MKRTLCLVLALCVMTATACGGKPASPEVGDSNTAEGSGTEANVDQDNLDAPAVDENTGELFSTSSEQAEAYQAFAAELSGKYAGKSLNIVTVSDPWLSGMKEIITEFEALTGCTVYISDLGYDACYSKEVLIASQKSNEADVFIYDYPWIGALSESLLPLNDSLTDHKALVNYEDFFAVGQAGSTWDENILGLPFAPYFTMLTYNTDLFEKAGIEKAPATVEELKEAAAALTSESTAGIALNNQSGTCVGQAYFEWIYNFGGKAFESCYPGSDDYYADMTPCLTSEESLSVVRFFKDMLQYEGSGALNMAWNERFSAFATGNAAIMSPWITDIMPLDDTEQSLVSECYATAPAVCAEGVKQHTPVGGYSMGVSRYAAESDLAVDFMLWFTSPETAYKFIGAGGLPARYSLIHDPELCSQYSYYSTLQQVVDTSFCAFRPQIPESFEIMDTIGQYIGLYLDGSMELEQAMKTAEEEAAKLLKDAGYTVNR